MYTNIKTACTNISKFLKYIDEKHINIKETFWIFQTYVIIKMEARQMNTTISQLSVDCQV